MRRVLAAVIGTAAGTTLLIGLKAGGLPGRSSTPLAAGAATPTPSGLLAPPDPPATATGPAAAPPGPTTPPGWTSTPRPIGSPRAATGATGTFTGSVAQTEYGPVQVRIVVAGGRMTDATAVQLPKSSSRSNQLSGRAAPILRQEALSAQSASIDTVSGATFTSAGYRNSLQAALDAAKRG
jgi:uncharacterized protein with FMN-binding domain